jgi:hypothetical protein
VYKGAVQIHGAEKDKKGNVEFMFPKFKVITVTNEANDKGIELDKSLQEYLKSRKLQNDEPVLNTSNEVPKQEPQQAPFNTNAAIGWKKKEEEVEQPVEESFDDPFTDDEEIPF